jgi:hypothetical protein
MVPPEHQPHGSIPPQEFAPLVMQHMGVGSAGFGAWRELATHIMTTNWVITGESVNYPMMYHRRILPSGPR